MTRWAWYALAGAAFIVLAASALVRWRYAAPTMGTAAVAIPAARPTNAAADDSLAAAEESIVSNDRFRLANEPAAVRFDPSDGSAGVASPVTATAPPRPVMTLKAIVGGPPWQAVVDGLPGQPVNTVVSAGARFDKLVARSVTRDSVVIQGPDTTWVLTFRRPR